MKKVLIAALSLACFASVRPVAADDELRQAWLEEAARLESLQDEYKDLRAEQEAARKAFETAGAAVDAAIVDPAIKVERLREMENALTDARDEAVRSAEDAAAVRRQIYEQMEMLEKLGAEAESVNAPLVEDAGIAGMWRAEWNRTGEFGLVRLATDGLMVSGTYRLTNGNAGSLSGSFAGGELKLEAISSARGFAGNYSGRINSRGDVIEGTWVSSDVAGAHRAVVGLKLTRLDDSATRDAMKRLR